TALPRFTLEPVAGVREHNEMIPNELVAVLRQLSDELEVSFSSMLLTAHAKVLGALSGGREVSSGYAVFEGKRPLPCQLTTEPHTWRALILETHRVELELLSYDDFPVDELQHELHLTKPLFETVFDPTGGAGGELTDKTVLWVGIVKREGIALR